MVDKRSLVLIALAAVAWSLMATGFAGYYFVQQARVQERFDAKEGLIGEVSGNYSVLASKSNLVVSDYSFLFGEYQWFEGENYSSFMGEYVRLVEDLRGNYSLVLESSPDLNETYSSLLSETDSFVGREFVSGEEFRGLLDEFYRLFSGLARRELEGLLGRMSVIRVDLLVDYGNGTSVWYNGTEVSLDASLFDVTRMLADVTTSYWSSMEPGHILLSSINGHGTGFWVWYYWDEASGGWVFGPVGCDAWALRDGGVYKWVSS